MFSKALAYAFPITGMVLVAGVGPAFAQSFPPPPDAFPLCEGLVFSTEEDFRSLGPRPRDGNQLISDGDAIHRDVATGATAVCARNAHLLRVFEVREDLGLDAIDVVFPERFVIAFSTDINDPQGRFSSGDLLATNGAIVPNVALVQRLDIPYDIGLDGLHFIGEPGAIVDFLERAREAGRDAFVQNPGLLIELLQAFNLDIWYSIEGTSITPDEPRILDGDLLSVLNGEIAGNHDLLDPSVPAGIPDRGVDFGLDGIAGDRTGNREGLLLSTEILYRGAIPFTDGDILRFGNGVTITNEDLIKPLEPLADFLGLDALSVGAEIDECLLRITHMSSIDVNDIDPVTGLFDTDRPFGAWIRVQGIVPQPDCPQYATHEFQVRVAVDGGPEVPIHHPMALGWRRTVAPCLGSTPYASDAGGWFTLTNYWRFNDCPSDASLAFWNSPLSATPPDPAGVESYVAVFRIAMRPIGGGAEVFSAPVRIRIDNVAPHHLIAELYNLGAAEPFGDQCKVDFGGEDIVIDIKGRVRDEHFREYQLHWTGGDVHTFQLIPVTLGRTYTSGRPDLGTFGTEPAAAINVPLGTLNLTAEYPPPGPVIECGYTIRLAAWDRAHLGVFTPSLNAFGHSNGNYGEYMQSFCLIP